MSLNSPTSLEFMNLVFLLSTENVQKSIIQHMCEITMCGELCNMQNFIAISHAQSVVA